MIEIRSPIALGCAKLVSWLREDPKIGLDPDDRKGTIISTNRTLVSKKKISIYMPPIEYRELQVSNRGSRDRPTVAK
mgnify:CR=1